MQTDIYFLGIYIVGVLLLGAILYTFLMHKALSKPTILLRLGAMWVLGNGVVMSLASWGVMTYGLPTLSLTKLVVGIFLCIMLLLRLIPITPNRIKHIKNIIPLLCITLLVLPLFIYSILAPTIGWDGLAMWLFKAKSFFQDGTIHNSTLYQSTQDYLYSSKTYPIGVPSAMALYYMLIGHVNDITVKGFLTAQYFFLLLISVGCIQTFLLPRKPFIALALGAIPLLLPAYLLYAVNGYVDITLACAILASYSFFLYGVLYKEYAYIYLSICMGLFTVLIKNEGQLFFVGLLLAVFLSIGIRQFYNLVRREKLFLLVSLLPASTALYWLYIIHTYHFQFLTAQPTIGITSLKRFSAIVFYFVDVLINPNLYGIIGTLVCVLLVYLIAERFEKKDYRYLILGFPIGFMIIGYVAAYMTTPLPFLTHLTSSLERLVLHILPPMIVYCGLLLKRRMHT